MINAKAGKSREEIRYLIRKKGKNFTCLCLEWGSSDNAISVALARPWPTIQDRIAAYLTLKPQNIWPERYSSTGAPICGYRRKAQNSSPSSQRNSQIAPAA